jgi:octaprenyl-diphosphate synthase
MLLIHKKTLSLPNYKTVLSMITIDSIRQPISADLRAFDEFVADNFRAEGEMLQEMLTYALSSRGKGVRPILTMLTACVCANTTDNNPEERHCSKRTYLAALLMEMIHTASLIHDDVLDSADERRGKPSVNAKWQSNMAIILGDYILARTMSLGMASAQYDLISYIGTAMATLCEGEVLQSQHAEKYDTTRDDYFDIIYRKTASLLGVSAALGALSVGANREEVERMRKFGEAIGIAFQIQDDILDYKRDNNTGKPANNDLREHKITLPLIAVMERATEEQKAAIIELLRRCSDDDKALDKLHNLVVENGGLEEASDILKSYIARAMHLLHKYDDTPYRQSLLDLCTFIAERDR